MAAPRLPALKARAQGADLKNPARFKDRANPAVVALGDPPEWMGGEQRLIWKAFVAELPWLAESDRALVEMATLIRARVYSGEIPGVQALNLLRQCLGSMGATPADRSKVPMPDDPGDEDPADGYVQ